MPSAGDDDPGPGGRPDLPPTDDALVVAAGRTGVARAVVASPAGTILQVNEALCAMLGRTEAELVGSDVADLVHRDDRPAEELQDDEAPRERRPSSRSSAWALHADGSVVVVEHLTTPVEGSEAVPQHVVHELVDVTAARRALERYRLLTENVSDTVVLSGTDGRLTYVSPAVSDTYGWAPEEMVGRFTKDFTHPDDLATAAARRRQLAEGRRPRVEVRILTKDGGSRWTSIIGRPVLDEAGRVVGGVSALRDVEEEHQARAALEASQARFRSALEAELDAHLILEPVRAAGQVADFVIVEANRAACASLGLSPDDAVGSRLLELVPSLRRDGLFDAYVAVTETGEPLVRDALGLHDQTVGEARLFDIRGVAAGEALSLIWRDVTDRVRVAEALVDSQLEALDLAARYEVARDEARTANQAKTVFLSRMSHELRTPLNAVLGFAQLLAMDELTAEQRADVGHIVAGGGHLLDLVSEVMDIAQIEEGRIALSMEPVAVADAVTAAVDLVSTQAAEASISLLSLGGPAVSVWTDRQRTIQVLVNFISNAIKYNRPGGSCEVSWEPTTDAMVAVRVRDTGPGVREEDFGRLFRPFDRLDAGLTDVEGTGIGLTLSDAVARALEGRIDVESVVGRGSTFSLVLPSSDPAVSPAGASTVGPPSTPRRSGRVLYVEDNPANLTLMERIFRLRPGVRLETQARGGAGLDAALQDPPDLLLLDLHLPDLSGEEVLLRLREDPRTAEVPVVVVTADVSPGVRRRTKERGAVGFLAKPVKVTEVLSLIDDLLAEERG